MPSRFSIAEAMVAVSLVEGWEESSVRKMS